VKTALFFVTVLWLVTPFADLNAQQVLTFTDKDSVKVGDIFELTYVVEGNYSSLNYPTQDEFEDDLEVISRQRFQVAGNRDSLVYRIQFFATGDIVISPKEITVIQNNSESTIRTAPVPLYFKSVLAETDEEFRPLKPIFDFARSAWPVILLLIIFALITYLAYRWHQTRELQPAPAQKIIPEPFVNPLDRLKESLNQLPKSTSLEEKKEFEKYYIELGDAIRLYIKRVYDFPALEMTTREITVSLQKEMASSPIIKITRSVLNEADMVKFANFKPDTVQAENILKKALEFVSVAEVSDREKIEYMKFKHEEIVEKSLQSTEILAEKTV
jgi:hypothetical protein